MKDAADYIDCSNYEWGYRQHYAETKSENGIVWILKLIRVRHRLSHDLRLYFKIWKTFRNYMNWAWQVEIISLNNETFKFSKSTNESIEWESCRTIETFL